MKRLSSKTPEAFKTRPARIMAGLVGLFLAYTLGTRAIDTGSWWQYFGTLVLLILSVRLIKRAFITK